MSRKERFTVRNNSLFNKLDRHTAKAIRKPQVELAPSATLLDNSDDIAMYQEELRNYKNVQHFDRLNSDMTKLLLRIGVPEKIIREPALRHLIGGPEAIKTEDYFIASLYANPIKLKAAARELHKYHQMYRQLKVRFVDQDAIFTAQYFQQLDLPITDYLEEILRSRGETIELIKMQIDWLSTPVVESAPTPQVDLATEASTTAEMVIDPNADIDWKFHYTPSPVMQQDQPDPTKKGYVLVDWQLHWSKIPWSKNPNHWVPITSQSRLATINELEKIARGDISVKPTSVVGALEYYMRKDVIQRALSARNKYVPEEIADWVKIKRGSDRIALFLPAEDQMVFFAANRDIAYRNLQR